MSDIGIFYQVKLDPTVVKGVNVVEQEKKKLTRPKGPVCRKEPYITRKRALHHT